MSNLFKVGDQVRCIDGLSENGRGPIVGKKYTITATSSSYVAIEKAMPTMAESIAELRDILIDIERK